MNRLKVMTIVGTRPEIIRLSRIIPALDSTCDHVLVHTGQNYDYELNQIFFDDLTIRAPDYYLDAAKPSGIKTIGSIILKIDLLLEKEKPEAVLILGDTNSSLAAISAKKRKIPIFHMEAGNRCFDFRVPEEINRRIVDHVADINMPYSDIARDCLLKEGISSKFIIKTGSPMCEVLSFYHKKIIDSKILETLKIAEGQYFLFSAHREENIESNENFVQLCEILNSLAEIYQLPVIVSTHPRTKKKLLTQSFKFNVLIRFHNALSFSDYNKLQLSAKVVLSDSGTITEESSILNFPALNIRDVNERPEGMEEGSVMMVGLNKSRILQSIRLLEGQGRGCNRTLSLVRDYDLKNVSDKVVRIILSYTDYVNREIWKKS